MHYFRTGEWELAQYVEDAQQLPGGGFALGERLRRRAPSEDALNRTQGGPGG